MSFKVGKSLWFFFPDTVTSFFFPLFPLIHYSVCCFYNSLNQPLHCSVSSALLCGPYVLVSRTQFHSPKSLHCHFLTDTFSHHIAEWKHELPAALGAGGENIYTCTVETHTRYFILKSLWCKRLTCSIWRFPVHFQSGSLTRTRTWQQSYWDWESFKRIIWKQSAQRDFTTQ